MSMRRVATPYWLAGLILLGSTALAMIPGSAGAAEVRSFRPLALFSLERDGVRWECAFAGEWVVGTLDQASGLFTATQTRLREARRRLARSRRSRERRRWRAAVGALRAELRVGGPICALGPPNEATPTAAPAPTSSTSSPTPTPIPTHTPTPSPTVTPTVTPTLAPPTPPGFCFNAAGDSLPGCFGIPAGLSGNRNRGWAYVQNNCLGCHGPRANLTWQEVDHAFTVTPQMAPFRPESAQDFADVVAYINRFSR